MNKCNMYGIYNGRNNKEKVINEILDIVHNDKKFQEFSKQTMNKIILGEI